MLRVALLAALLCTACAHPSASPDSFKAGAYAGTAIKISHGCGKLATTSVSLEIPESLTGVRPRQLPEWEIEVEEGDYQMPLMSHGRNVTSGVSRITWTGELPDAYFQLFEISFKIRDVESLAALALPGDEAGVPGMRPIFIPVTQACGNVTIEWVEPWVASSGEEEPDYPAVVLWVDERAPMDAHSG